LRRRIGRQPGLNVSEREARGGQLGAGAIVQFLREMAAHGFLRVHDLGGEFAYAFAQARDLGVFGVRADRYHGRRIHCAPVRKLRGRQTGCASTAQLWKNACEPLASQTSPPRSTP
jgi:hypothetical protein